MATSLELFRELIPEAADVTDARVNTLLGVAALDECPEVWGGVFQVAMVWKAGHLALVSPTDASDASTGGSSSASGPVSSVKTGDLSVSYGGGSLSAGGGAASEAVPPPWNRTHAGEQYYALLRRRSARVPSVYGYVG